MYCNICGSREESINIFKINMCKKCFNEIANISVMDEDYDRYKNLMRIIISYYINPKMRLNPVN